MTPAAFLAIAILATEPTSATDMVSGSYETGFNENDENQKQWPLPNVLGIEANP